MVNLSTSNPRYEDVPLNIPPFQWSTDLPYWDASMGAVSDSSRRSIWLSLAILSMIVTIIIGFVLTSIIIKPEVRRKPFNIFLIFLMIPDLIFNACEPPIYLLNYVAGKYVSVEVCKFQGVILAFGIIANCHINALIALEIHKMLRNSHGRKRYFPPSARQVSTRCLASYAAVAAVTVVWALNFERLPARVFLNGGGSFCTPGPYDTNSALIYYLGLGPFALYIPFGICGYVTLDVLRKGLLPKKGEGKRILTIFFFRLLLVFLVFWAPTIVSVVVSTNPWFIFVGGLWSLSQGAVSAITMLGKGDIRDCVMDLLALVSCGLLSSGRDSLGETNQSNLSGDSPAQANGQLSIKKSSIYFDDFSEEAQVDETTNDPENPYLRDDHISDKHTKDPARETSLTVIESETL